MWKWIFWKPILWEIKMRSPDLLTSNPVGGARVISAKPAGTRKQDVSCFLLPRVGAPSAGRYWKLQRPRFEVTGESKGFLHFRFCFDSLVCTCFPQIYFLSEFSRQMFSHLFFSLHPSVSAMILLTRSSSWRTNRALLPRAAGVLHCHRVSVSVFMCVSVWIVCLFWNFPLFCSLLEEENCFST